jgi:hypothetical protein
MGVWRVMSARPILMSVSANTARPTQRCIPASPEARLFVDELIHCEWTLRRRRARL